MNIIGKKAPEFVAPAVSKGKIIEKDFSLEQYRNEKYIVLFFYPMDFTLIFRKEMLKFQDSLEEFNNRDAVVVGCSMESEYTHLEWLKTPREKGGIEGILYPLIADVSKSIARKFGVLRDSFLIKSKEMAKFERELMPQRAIFIIDKKGIIRHELIGEDCCSESVDKTLYHLDVIRLNDRYEKIYTNDGSMTQSTR